MFLKPLSPLLFTASSRKDTLFGNGYAAIITVGVNKVGAVWEKTPVVRDNEVSDWTLVACTG